MSLVAVVVAFGLLGFLTLVTIKLISLGQRGAESGRAGQEVATLMMTARDGLSCCHTLGIDASTSLPITCDPTQVYSIKRVDDTLMATANDKIGEWTVIGKCDPTQKELIIYRSRRREDLLTTKQYNVELDLFRKTSDFCRGCFITPTNLDACCPKLVDLGPTPTPTPTCTGSYVFSIGWRIRSFVNGYYGRKVIPDGGAGSGYVKANGNDGVVSRQKVCELKGFERVVSYGTKTYSSCSDNTHAYWRPSRNKWRVQGACAAGNRYVNRLVCGCN